MIDTSILTNNLNEEISYSEYFRALGYKASDTIYFRTFPDKKGQTEAAGHKMEVSLDRIDSILPTLRQRNSEDMGIFFVVNGGGQTDKEVKTARAQFIDFDDFDFRTQIEKLLNFRYEPSIIVKTRKSLHCYWLLKDGSIKRFRQIQQKLNALLGSDPSIKNESRVMRLYGFEHRKADPIMVTLIKYDPSLRYTQDELEEALPAVQPIPELNDAPKRLYSASERVPVGQGYKWIISRIGAILDKIGDSTDDETICTMVRSEILQRYEAPEKVEDEEGFRKKYLPSIQKLRERHLKEASNAGWLSDALKVWKFEHPGEEFDPSHGKHTWFEVREAGEVAEDAGTFDKIVEEMSKRYEKRPQKAPQSHTEISHGDATHNRDYFWNYAVHAWKHENPDKKFPETDEAWKEAEAAAYRAQSNGLTLEELSARPIEKVFRDVSVSDYLGSGDYDGDIEYFKKYRNRKTGFPNIDRYLTLYPGLACLTGATSLGKTSFCVQLADQLLDRNETVLYFALEQLPIELVTKSLARRYFTETDNPHFDNVGIKNGCSDDVLRRVRKERAEASKNYRIVQGDFTVTAEEIAQYVDKFVADTGIKPVVIIDYFQLIAPPEKFKGTDKEIADHNIKRLKLMQRDNELFVLLISNMARSGYMERITEASFKESGLIEYTCDYLLGLQLSILENDSFFTKTGSRGGSKETQANQKEKMVYLASKKNPKEIVFKCVKNRNGVKVFKAFFKYRPDYDYFEPDFNSRFDTTTKASKDAAREFAQRERERNKASKIPFMDEDEDSEEY